jgi:opacity protein-like surface antigen
MTKRLIALLFISVLCCAGAFAQEEAPRYTFNVGVGPGFPLGDVSNFANTGTNVVAGGGVNLTHMFGVDGEFMWQDLPPKRSVLNAVGAPNGSARVYSVTGNILAHTAEARRLGIYGIAGIGWYHRSWDLTAPSIGIGTFCFPSYLWWGVVCTNGLVETTTTLRSGSTNDFGFNVGAGITYRLGSSHAKFYTELRYHHAYDNKVDTQVLPLTFGIRW